ncbi:MAG: Na+/H+ antiporter NhaC [Saprospiraceae bacterium]|nr:Na+/H+ antiporter NhaC [Bacteroidia bacterium]NNK89256.1 Na+/H+ antiporter NhaC [Saprospiraceae bacterium]
MTKSENKEFLRAIFPILVFFLLLVYGLFIHPLVFGEDRLPVEVLILIALSVNAVFLIRLGYGWDKIQEHIIKKVGESVPVLLILFSVGVLIGSWIVSGTIPMLIYYGISMIDPDWVYIFAFIVCIIFSLLTGTSWGSAGTIGIVMMGIAQIYDADLFITAGAIVGGSFFGDKMSPLSDTTNIASLAADVKLFDHIRSMMYTTGPAALIAAAIYIFLSPAIQANATAGQIEMTRINETLQGIRSIFNFNVMLLFPLAFVVWGAVTKKPIVLVLLFSAWFAMVLAFVFQDFKFTDIFNSFNKGFSVEMANSDTGSEVLNILNRGGLYNLIEGIVITILIFAFIGTLDVINAIDTVIKRMMRKLDSPKKTISAALTVTALTNLTTSNQYATSFIIGEAFKKKFNKMKIPRKVLSRTIEDAGTMLENLAPWTPSGIFMASTLGVSAIQYGPYQFLSLINILIAYFFAFTGIACFYRPNEKNE